MLMVFVVMLGVLSVLIVIMVRLDVFLRINALLLSLLLYYLRYIFTPVASMLCYDACWCLL